MSVDNSITEKNSCYIKKILDEGQVPQLRENPRYEDQLAFIRDIQHAILQFVPYEEQKKGLPKYENREPENIYKYKGKLGACYDRSRLIEKTLRKHGFTTRHVFIMSTKKPCGILKGRSHAVSEVLTKEGWLVVDSNDDWVPLDIQNHPYSMKSIKNELGILWPKWEKPIRHDMKKICSEPFMFLYGLYSRHGGFYPPFRCYCRWRDKKHYICFPDINWDEFLYNCLCLKKLKEWIWGLFK